MVFHVFFHVFSLFSMAFAMAFEAKEPHFWLQSCGRELRNFFEIRPVGPQRRAAAQGFEWILNDFTGFKFQYNMLILFNVNPCF